MALACMIVGVRVHSLILSLWKLQRIRPQLMPRLHTLKRSPRLRPSLHYQVHVVCCVVSTIELFSSEFLFQGEQNETWCDLHKVAYACWVKLWGFVNPRFCAGVDYSAESMAEQSWRWRAWKEISLRVHDAVQGVCVSVCRMSTRSGTKLEWHAVRTWLKAESALVPSVQQHSIIHRCTSKDVSAT